jgi:hypothetical protein
MMSQLTLKTTVNLMHYMKNIFNLSINNDSNLTLVEVVTVTQKKEKICTAESPRRQENQG